MKKITYMLAAISIVIFSSSFDAQGRGGRGGGGRGGGGFSGGGGRGGGGYSRPAPSRSPSMSRPSSGRSNYSRPSTGRPSSSRPSSSRPSTRPSSPPSRPSGSRPGAGSRPGTGSRPNAGSRPSQSQLNNFLNIPNSSGGRPGTGAANRPSGGGAAGDFLRNNDASQRPGADRAGNRSDRTDNRSGNRSDRTDNRAGNQSDRASNRSDRRENGPAGNRPDRIENRGERQTQRTDRRNEARNQFHDNHPRADFWKDHPNWARFRWNRPYRWATWGVLGGWLGGVGSDATAYDYDYGDNIYYEGDQVYYGDDAVATTEEYAEQAQTLAESAPEVDEKLDWLSLGVFAITKDGEDSGPPPTMFVQLAVNKQGIIAGTFSNTATEKTEPVEGMIDEKSQRAAWTIEGKKWPVMETGMSNLTKDTSPALVHFENGETQQWLLIRMEEPKESKESTPPSP